MLNQIQTSLDWNIVKTNINATGLMTSLQLFNETSVIDKYVGALSIEEINCRRLGKQTRKHKEMVTAINKLIRDLELAITVGLLKQ